MTRDEERSARLLFAEELAAGTVDEARLDERDVHAAVVSRPVPSLPSRALQRLMVRRGRLDVWSDLDALQAIRREVLGNGDAEGEPRFLVRVDEFPHRLAWDRPDDRGTDGFRTFHAILRDAGVPYLIATVPRVPREPDDPEGTTWRDHDADELETIGDLRRDPGIAFAVNGLDHRTRHRNPRRHSELTGLSGGELDARLDLADAVLRERGLPTDIVVPPFDRFGWKQYPVLARRYEIVAGGPESVGTMGWHRTPLWRGDAVYLPAYHPFHGGAGEVLTAVDEARRRRLRAWIPIVLQWAREREQGWSDLERLATALAGLARPWDELLSAVRTSRMAP